MKRLTASQEGDRGDTTPRNTHGVITHSYNTTKMKESQEVKQ